MATNSAFRGGDSGDGDEIAKNTGQTLFVSPSPVATRRKRPSSWPLDGADAVLALTPADLPPVPWRSGSLKCFDSARLLNELRIDLTVIGCGGVNHKSGRLRRDVRSILEAAKRHHTHPQETNP